MSFNIVANVSDDKRIIAKSDILNIFKQFVVNSFHDLNNSYILNYGNHFYDFAKMDPQLLSVYAESCITVLDLSSVDYFCLKINFHN